MPGCGTGYDVLLLSAFGYDVIGLDFSDKAIEAAKEHEKSKGADEVYKARDESVGKGAVTWVVGDFFKDEALREVDGEGTFDILFDHTVWPLFVIICRRGFDKGQFLSALPPSLRPTWAARMAQLLSPTGVLICIEWPSTKAPDSGGPPWALPPQVYEAHLPRPGKELKYGEDGTILVDKLGPEPKDGLLRTEHFHPKRTHKQGMSEGGTVTDWVGIWKHKPIV